MLVPRSAVKRFDPHVHKVRLHERRNFRLPARCVWRRQRSCVRIGYRLGGILQPLARTDYFHVLAAARKNEGGESNDDKRTKFHVASLWNVTGVSQGMP